MAGLATTGEEVLLRFPNGTSSRAWAIPEIDNSGRMEARLMKIEGNGNSIDWTGILEPKALDKIKDWMLNSSF